MKSWKSNLSLFVVSMLVMIFLSGCYINADVTSESVGLVMPDGTAISLVVGPGRYTDWGYFATLQEIKISALTFEWEDPDLVTKDKQPIGLKIGITVARNGDSTCAKKLWQVYNREAVNDDALKALVLHRIPRAAKAVTTRYTLDEMLGISGATTVTTTKVGREALTQDLFEFLESELADACITLIDVGVNNISPDSDYLALLKQKANAAVAIEVAKQETKKLDEQLLQERSQTQIEVEKAKRQNEVNQALSQVYAQSPQYYELKKLELYAEIFGPSDKIVFLPTGADLTLLFGNGNLVPLTSSGQ